MRFSLIHNRGWIYFKIHVRPSEKQISFDTAVEKKKVEA